MSRTEARLPNIRRALLTWADLNLREYPWRCEGIGSYRLLVAELLLKRTTATAAARIYDPFIAKYPSVDRLALATEDELAQVLMPIGLSRQRARSIRQLALALAQQHNGIPTTMDQLRSLPGIGEYTAQAVLSFGHGIPVAVVDGNVERVIGRVFQGILDSSSDRKTVLKIAADLLPRKYHRSFNFALLDLGALVCRPARPRCNECPLQKLCDYAVVPPISRTHSALRAIRHERGLSLMGLANKAGVSKLTIVNIEAGRVAPRTQTLRKIAHAMGVPLSEIYGDVERPSEDNQDANGGSSLS